MSATTKERVEAGLAILQAVLETVRESGECPEGPLYAALMGRIDLQGFNSMIALAVRSGLIRKTGNMLAWIGPDPNEMRTGPV